MLINNFKRFVLVFIFTIAILSGLTSFRPFAKAQIPINLAEIAKIEIFRTVGIPLERLTIVNQATLAGTDIKQFKVIDSQGNIYGVSLDGAGNKISPEKLKQAVDAINNKGFVGKLEEELATLIAQYSNSPIKVIFYLNSEMIPPYQGSSRTEHQAHLNKLKDRYAEIQKPIVDELKKRGQQTLYQSLYAPLVVAEVSPSIIQMIAGRSDVNRIYLSRVLFRRQASFPGFQPTTPEISSVVVQADIVNARGYTGIGETVGVVEEDRIAPHPQLPAIQRELCRPTSSVSTDYHKTAVASVIQSNDTQFAPGIAPGISIVDGIMANSQIGAAEEQEFIAAIDCVINTASATNISDGMPIYGTFGNLARYLDNVIYNTGATIVVAASNECNQKIANPEIAFNAIAVGYFSHNNTTSFNDDIAPCTGVVVGGSYMNPDSPHGDREEPDVVAPGHQITMVTNSGTGYIKSSGTSFAAPHVTAGVGLLRARKPELFNRPAEVRAIMMASARHNLEGNSRLSDRDGSGGIMLAAADTVAANGQSDHIINNGAATNFPIYKTFTATSGQKVRVVIAWDHKMPLGKTLTEPTTDLDLEVYCGSTLVGSSTSYDNNYEIVEFTASSCSGGYTAKIPNYRTSTGYEQIGFAMSKTDT